VSHKCKSTDKIRLQFVAIVNEWQNTGRNHDIKIGNRCFENVFGNDDNKSKPDSGGT
jgi:hypothetical protein